MDMQGIDWFNVGSGLAILGSIAKGFMASRQADKAEAHAKAIESDREATKIDRDRKIQELETRQAVMDEKCATMTRRLEEGSTHFERIEQELKASNERMSTELSENSKLLQQMLGALKNAGLKI